VILNGVPRAGKSSIAAVIPAPVQRWQDQVHALGVYDLEVDTSVLTPEECASAIRERLTSPPSALRKVSDTF